MPGIPRESLLRHAAAILADTPLPAGYPVSGRAWPTAREVRLLRQAGWPVETITALLPSETAAPNARHKPVVRQPIAVVPREWLAELARRCGCELVDVCRGIIPDEERP